MLTDKQAWVEKLNRMVEEKNLLAYASCYGYSTQKVKTIVVDWMVDLLRKEGIEAYNMNSRYLMIRGDEELIFTPVYSKKKRTITFRPW